jgi:glycosyltransferase involved in cell wall biosynthesis
VASGATRIITVSRHTRYDVAQLVPGAAARIQVVPNGATALCTGAGSPPLPAGVTRPYLLAVGSRRLHKNFRCAVDVLALLAMDEPALRLVVSGEDAPHWREVMAHASQLGVAERVIAAGTSNDGQLAALYANAEALLFPSLYEGFGLPLLEAMQCGTPVVASNVASIPEVAGDAALLFNPHDAAGMAGAVRRLRGDAQLRSDFVERGRVRAAQFTWERCAELTESILLEAAR